MARIPIGRVIRGFSAASSAAPKLSIQIQGIDILQRRLIKSQQNIANAIEAALTQPAREVLRASQVIVPIDTGLLKSSGRIDTTAKTSDKVTVEVSYGKIPFVHYAFIVHERPAKFQQRKRDITLKTGATKQRTVHVPPHRLRQNKYLQKPFIEIIPKLPEKIVRHFRLETLIPKNP